MDLTEIAKRQESWLNDTVVQEKWNGFFAKIMIGKSAVTDTGTPRGTVGHDLAFINDDNAIFIPIINLLKICEEYEELQNLPEGGVYGITVICGKGSKLEMMPILTNKYFLDEENQVDG